MIKRKIRLIRLINVDCLMSYIFKFKFRLWINHKSIDFQGSCILKKNTLYHSNELVSQHNRLKKSWKNILVSNSNTPKFSHPARKPQFPTKTT